MQQADKRRATVAAAHQSDAVVQSGNPPAAPLMIAIHETDHITGGDFIASEGPAGASRGFRDRPRQGRWPRTK